MRTAKTDQTADTPWAHRSFYWFCHAVAQMTSSISIVLKAIGFFFTFRKFTSDMPVISHFLVFTVCTELSRDMTKPTK